MMTMKIITDTGTVIRAYVCNSIDAVNLLMDLTSSGMKCIKWSVEREA